MICDTHTHSMYSFDGSCTVDDMCRTAIEKGVKVLAITDHCEAMTGIPFSPDDRARCAGALDDMAKAQDKFAPHLTLLLGCELGQPHMNTDYARDLLNSFGAQYDYVIGSMHFLPVNIDLYDITYTREDYRERLAAYFDETYAMLDVGGYQTLGHLDYILRLLSHCFDGTPNYLEFMPQVEKILRRTADLGLALEVNTSCLRKKMGVLGMEDWVMEKFREYGGRHIAVGSDAHSLNDIGAGFDEAFALLRRTGYDSYVYFMDKQPVRVPICD